jgi:hypothetical protein
MEKEKHDEREAWAYLSSFLAILVAITVLVAATLRVYAPGAFQAPAQAVLEAPKVSQGPVGFCESPSAARFPFPRVNYEVYGFVPCKEVPFDGRA